MAADFDHVELNNPLSIKISKFLFILVSIFLVMHFGFKIIQYSQGVDQIAYRVLRRLFDLDGENTIPAWFSACLLWTSGVCLFAIGYLKPTLLSKYWYVLSFSFIYLSIDESLSLHEKASRGMQQIFEANDFSIPYLYNLYWIIPAGLLVLVLFLFLLPFLRALPPATRYLFVFAGSVYVMGAIGLELVGGFAANMMPYMFYEVIFPFEEFFEMSGVIIFLHGLTAILFSEWREGRKNIGIVDRFDF